MCCCYQCSLHHICVSRVNNDNVHQGMETDEPSSSLMNSTMNPKKKTMKGEGVGAHFLARNTLGVEGHAGASGWD
jgi:hypothetical protein